jgi:formylmethanofuran dehydrogenase subunit E
MNSPEPTALDEIWSVLNAVRVALKFNRPSLLMDLQALLPRIEEVLERAEHQESNVRRLVLRAHDMMCGEHSSDTFADCSDLVDDIRVALNLPVTDCDYCHQCIAKVEAIEQAGQTLCRDCAEAEDLLSHP